MIRRSKEKSLQAELADFFKVWLGEKGGVKADWTAFAGRLVAECEASEKEAVKLSKHIGPRWDHGIIQKIIPCDVSVLDLGCGNGDLLASLISRKKVNGQGLEINPKRVAESVANGVPVFQGDIDEGLGGFLDKRFDFVILEKTLQTVHRPVPVLKEMIRVGKKGIVSFPNFGYWRIRAYLAATGRMPITRALPKPWYESDNIHLFSIEDFLEFRAKLAFKVMEAHVLVDGKTRPYKTGDNLWAEEALFVISRKAPPKKKKSK